MNAANTKNLPKSDHSKRVFFKDGTQDGRQNLYLLIEHIMHMVHGQFRRTHTVYLSVILHVSSIHHIKYILFFGI